MFVFYRFRVIFGLFVLMGISWLMNMISMFASGHFELLLFIKIFISIMTGVGVFIMFVCKPRVWNLLEKRFPCFTKFRGLFNPASRKSKIIRQEIAIKPATAMNETRGTACTTTYYF